MGSAICVVLCAFDEPALSSRTMSRDIPGWVRSTSSPSSVILQSRRL